MFTNRGMILYLRIKFSKIPGRFNPTNGIIKIVYYTTTGSDGNFVLGQVDEDTISDLSIQYSQDISDKYQEALITLIPTVSIIGNSSSGGSNAKDIEAIRKIVINANNSEIITPSTLAAEAEKEEMAKYIARKYKHYNPIYLMWF